MIEKIHEYVSVGLWSDHAKRTVYPKVLIWKGKTLSVTQLGLHHTYREGKTLYHVFSVVAANGFFRLVLNTENLVWTLEEVADGFTN